MAGQSAGDVPSQCANGAVYSALMARTEFPSKRKLEAIPLQLWGGLLLILVAWPLNWALDGLRTHLLFFPLWLGYILVVDGIVCTRRGTSLLSRSPKRFAGLFILSAPAWWLFEVLNWRTQNWQYIGREYFTGLEYTVLASLSFSTVIPAVFETAELVSIFPWVSRIRRGPRITPTGPVTLGFFAAGWIMLGLLAAWPRLFYPFIWLSLYFILEPINVWLGHRSLARQTASGDWSPVIGLWLGTLVCGFFWEMWNYFSYPHWVYHTPGVEFLYIFEMPLLGYGGYLPFGLELFALYHLVAGRLRQRDDYVQFGGEVTAMETFTE